MRTPRDLGGSADRERLLSLYRGWQRALRGGALPLWLRRSGREVATGLTVFSFVSLLFLDEPLWSIRLFTSPWTPWFGMAPRSGAMVASVFLLVWAINIWLFHGLLEQITRKPWFYRPWVLILRSALAGFPLLGLLTVPAWRRAQEACLPWALRREPVTPDLSLAFPVRSPIRRPGSVAAFAWLVGSGFVAFALVVLWVMQRALDDPSRRTETLFVSVPLRLFIFAILLACLRSEDVRQSASPRLYRLALASSFSWLIPVPYLSVAGMLIPLAVEPATARSETLIWQALARRQGVSRLPLWLGLEAALRKSWEDLPRWQRLRRPPRATGSSEEIREAQNQILKLWDFQTFALIFDAAVLGWCLSWLAGRNPSWHPTLAPMVQALWMGPLALCFAGVCLSAVHFLLVLLRAPGRLRALDRHPYARYLAHAQLALAAGFLLGWHVQQGHAKEAGILMMYLCGLILMLWGLVMMFRRLLPRTPLMRERFRDMAHEVGLLFALMPVFGLGGPLGLLPWLLIAWVAFSPVRAWLLGRALLPWLLRPFEWRDVFAQNLPAHIRSHLGILSAISLLPLGGLAIPLGIWIRHRRWPMIAPLASRLHPC